MASERVSVGHLRARLGDYVRRARAGEVIVVTDRGRPVAQLAPLEAGAALAERIAELADAGLVRGPGKALGPAFLDVSRPADPEGRSLRYVLEGRARGW